MRTGLVFTDTSIKLVKITSGKPVLAKIPLEKGLVEDGYIKDVKKFQAVLTKLSRQLSLGKSEIVLGISEKHIFSKAITITDSNANFDEKIHEEVSIHAPGGAASYSDWQVIEKLPDQETIFVASAASDLLDSYVSVLQSASLSAVGIEPLAFAVARHLPKAVSKVEKGKPQAEKKPTASLIVDLEESEVLLTITNEEDKIALTSVLSHAIAGHENELLSEIANMRAFYDKKNGEQKIGRVLLTGEGAAERLKNQIATNLGLPSDYLRIPNKFLPPQDALSFFPVFALTDLPVAFPKNHTCINLLAEEVLEVEEQRKKVSHREQYMEVGTLLFGTLSLLYFILLAFLFWSQYTFDAQIAKQKELLKSGKSSSLRTTIASVNKYLSVVKKMKAKEDNSLVILPFLAEKTPGGIVISHYTIDITKNMVSLSGQSLEREILLGFKQVLESEETFQNVNIPLTSLEKKGATTFSLSFEGTKK